MNNIMSNVKAVIFDIDDTLFDHRFSCRKGLTAVQKEFECFRKLTLDEFEKEHRRLLDEIHLSQVLTGKISIEQARIERFKIAFQKVGIAADETMAKKAVRIYRENYQANRRAVPGSKELLEKLKPRVKIAVLSNNLYEEQRGKLIDCGLDKFVDVTVVSEHVGVTKPAPEIFLETLKRLDRKPQEAVMIGDSWEWDVMGAMKVGIKPIWYNQYKLPCPDSSAVKVLDSYFPTEEVVELILGD
jgi:HAD superfamily hydrolase (TIGR01549 family)